jgi:hypothetical protein
MLWPPHAACLLAIMHAKGSAMAVMLLAAHAGSWCKQQMHACAGNMPPACDKTNTKHSACKPASQAAARTNPNQYKHQAMHHHLIVLQPIALYTNLHSHPDSKRPRDNNL